MKNELLIWFGWSIGSSIWFLQCCSSFRGSSSIWGARAPRVVKMASQLRILSSLAYQADSSSPFIYQTWIFCKKNGSKSSFLPEIEVQTFWYTLYAVTTACCVPLQIPREIWKNTAGKSARSEGGLVKDQTFSGYFFASFPKNILWNQLFQSSLSLPKVFLIILGTRSVTTLMTWILLVLRQPWILLTLPQNPALCKPNHYLCHHN